MDSPGDFSGLTCCAILEIEPESPPPPPPPPPPPSPPPPSPPVVIRGVEDDEEDVHPWERVILKKRFVEEPIFVHPYHPPHPIHSYGGGSSDGD